MNGSLAKETASAILDRMARGDRICMSIFFGNDGISLNVYPADEGAEDDGSDKRSSPQ